MSKAAFFCFLFLLGVRDVVTFPPDAPRLQPSVTWEILADEILAIHPLRFRGAFNVCIYMRPCTVMSGKMIFIFFNLASEEDENLEAVYASYKICG